jgi:hypothetical protein
MVVYHDHSPGSYRQYSYRDFVKFYPWAVANGLVRSLPPSQVNLQITPYNSVYPSPYFLLPNQDLSRLLINPFIQLILGSGEWKLSIYFAGVTTPMNITLEAGTQDPASSSVFRLFIVRAPLSSCSWLCGYVLDRNAVRFLSYGEDLALTHFFIAGPPQATSPIGNLDIREYCLMVPVMASPTVFP